MPRDRRFSRNSTEEVLFAAEDNTARRQLGWYVRNCALSPAAAVLQGVIMERVRHLKGRQPDEQAQFPELDDDDRWPRSKEAKARHRRALWRVLNGYSHLPPGEDGLERNVRYARDEFRLDSLETEILLLLLRYERNSELEEFADEAFQKLHDPARTLAAFIGADPHDIRSRIGRDGALIRDGMVSLSNDFNCLSFSGRSGCLQLARPLLRVMHDHYASQDKWLSALIGPALSTPLDWKDFEHLGSVRDLAARLVAAAARERATGINVLVHGPVGTGKTEFSKALAAQSRLQIWSVGEADDEGEEPSREERLASLKLAQHLLAKRAGALILFDEAEDLFSVFEPRTRRSLDGSKAHINRLLEQSPVPILWTCNEIGAMDPAVLRRMTLAVEVRTPTEPVRARIWHRILSENAVTLDKDAVQRLSTGYEAPPAVAANAARAAALSGGGEADIGTAMAGVLHTLGIHPRVSDIGTKDFDPRLVNCAVDLERLAERLASSGASRRWSLCLYGAPGTGKSQFARWLASRLGMEVAQQRASDLLSCLVGESEKQIAAAFRAARAQGTLLVIDEADSLLSDRRDAVRSWEVTQVNEMLTWMESHPLPFVCTTNLIERIDLASLRRFTKKLRFDSLTAAQAEAAFARFFGAPAPRPLAERLTPGDFATVRRKRELFGSAPPHTLADWLEEEAAAKGFMRASIGFRPSCT